MENKDSFKLSKDTDNIVELLYDQPKQGQNSYGAWYLYGVNKEGQDTSFFATENLHKKLSTFGRGAKVNIRKDEYAPGKFAWNVIPQGDTQPKPLAVSGNSEIDKRTHDIHKQVCLKLAVDMIDKKNEILTTGDLVTIEANMMNLLNVLEGKSASEIAGDEAPF